MDDKNGSRPVGLLLSSRSILTHYCFHDVHVTLDLHTKLYYSFLRNGPKNQVPREVSRADV